MSLGLDPEWFVTDQDGFIVPAEAFIPTPSTEKGSRVVYDNAAIEIRPSPRSCKIALVGNIREVVWQATSFYRLARLRGEIPRTTGYNLAPAAPIREEDIDKYPSLAVFGCDPSYNLAPDGTLGLSEVEGDPMFPWRCAGYHLHRQKSVRSVAQRPDGTYIRTKTLSPEDVAEKMAPCIQLADATLGLVDAIMCDRAGWGHESRIRRLELGYGLPGDYRVRGSGTYSRVVEYRTMSPWPLSHPMWSWWAAGMYRDCFRMRKPKDLVKVLPDRTEIVQAIMECDGEGAMKLWEASVVALMGKGVNFMKGGGAFNEENLRLLKLALINDGYTYYTTGWPMERSWFRNERRHTEFSIHKTHDHKPARYHRAKDRSDNKIVAQGTHDPGARRGFPSGSRWIRQEVYGNPPLPPIGEGD